MEIKSIKFKDVKRAPYNPRVDLKPGMPEYEKLAKSIHEFGHVLPMVYNTRSGNLTGGHQTMTVLENDGITEAQMSIVDLDDAHEKALNLVLNKAVGLWDDDKLSILLSELNELPDFDFETTGFDMGELDELVLPEPVDDLFDTDDALADIKEPVTKLSDIILLGQHRLMCGDSTNAENVNRLMDGDKAILLHADPPYGMGKENEGVHNDNLYNYKLDLFQMSWWNIFRPHIEDNASVYIWGTAYDLWRLWHVGGLCDSEQLTFRNELVWNKGSGQGMMSDGFRSYPLATERCLFFMVGVQGFNTNADNYFNGWEPIRDYLLQSRLAMGWDVPKMKQIVGHSDLYRDHWTSKSQFSFPTKKVYEAMKAEADKNRNETKNDAFKKEYDELKKEYYSTRAYFNNTHDTMIDVWEYGRVVGDDRCGHATPKPVTMIGRIVKSSSPDGMIVVEPFMGSGTTLIACEQTNRICYGMELDPVYCDVIVKRYIDYSDNADGVYLIRDGDKTPWQHVPPTTAVR